MTEGSKQSNFNTKKIIKTRQSLVSQLYLVLPKTYSSNLIFLK